MQTGPVLLLPGVCAVGGEGLADNVVLWEGQFVRLHLYKQYEDSSNNYESSDYVLLKDIFTS